MAARKRLGEILVQAGVLGDAQLRVALTEQKRWGGPLGRLLVDMKLISEEAMVQALSHQLNFPAINLDQRQIDAQVLDLVPADLAEQHSVVPFHAQGKFLDVAMSDPTNLGIIDELRIRTRMNVRPYLAGPKAIERAIARLYGRGVSLHEYSTGSSGGSRIDGGRMIDVEFAQGQATPVVSPPPPPMNRAGTSGPPVVAPPSINTPPPAAMRRAQQFEQLSPVAMDERGREIAALQERVAHLEALIARDEDVLRKLLSLFVEKGLATREEILERIK
jgi:hypothetical protein